MAAAHIPFSGADPLQPLQLQTRQLQQAQQQHGSAPLPEPARVDAPLTFMMVRAPVAFPLSRTPHAAWRPRLCWRASGVCAQWDGRVLLASINVFSLLVCVCSPFAQPTLCHIVHGHQRPRRREPCPGCHRCTTCRLGACVVLQSAIEHRCFACCRGARGRYTSAAA